MTVYENPDWLALMAGIIGDPDNDLRRLIVADWLEEHGEEARAEFIRTQVVLTVPCDPWCRGGAVQENIMRVVHGCLAAVGQRDIPCPKCGPLRLRETDLFRQYRQEWWPDWHVHTSLTPFPHYLSCFVIRRGFVAELHAAGAWVWGSDCDRCDETNTACVHCGGTGHTPAYGYAVIRSHPVTRVVVTDAIRRTCTWGWGGPHDFQYMPGDVWERFTTTDEGYPFETEKLATDALSDAVIMTARSTHTQKETRCRTEPATA